MRTKYLRDLDYAAISDHYNHRVEISKCLLSLLNTGKVESFTDLALGISDPYGNYSASEHHLGHKILAVRSRETVFKLAKKLSSVESEKEMLACIYLENIPNLKVSVGSEIAMLLQPDKHWVANSRSIWAYLLDQHGSVADANEALQLYRDGSEDSDMKYKMWCEIHKLMEPHLLCIAESGAKAARNNSIEPGEILYIWADAMANALYEQFSG